MTSTLPPPPLHSPSQTALFPRPQKRPRAVVLLHWGRGQGVTYFFFLAEDESASNRPPPLLFFSPLTVSQAAMKLSKFKPSAPSHTPPLRTPEPGMADKVTSAAKSQTVSWFCGFPASPLCTFCTAADLGGSSIPFFACLRCKHISLTYYFILPADSPAPTFS